MVGTNQVRLLPLVEMALHGIPDGCFEFLPRIRFGVDGMAQGTSDVSTFDRILHQKKHFPCHLPISFGPETNPRSCWTGMPTL